MSDKDLRRTTTARVSVAVANKMSTPSEAPTCDPSIVITDSGMAANTKTRLCLEAVAPSTSIPTDAQLFVPGGRVNLAFMRDHLFREGRLTNTQALTIINAATAVLRDEQTLLEIEAPMTVCGKLACNLGTRIS